MSLKSIIKSSLKTLGLGGIWDSYSRNKFKKKYSKAISSVALEDRFTNIYDQDIWSANKESKSGSGSTLTATRNIREELPAWVTKLEIDPLLDLGCGDYHWMKEIALPCAYIGADIVKSVIDENQHTYGSDRVSFIHLDAVKGPIPQAGAILCREVIFHLSLEDGMQVIENCRASGARYLITTSNPTITENANIRSGQFREINLEIAPYSLGKPMLTVPDDSISEGRLLCVWKLGE